MPITIKLRGKIKQDILIDDQATALDLRKEIASLCGLQMHEFKMIAGGKSLTESDKKLQDYGLADGKLIMVVASPQSQVADRTKQQEEKIVHVENIMETAAKLAARSRQNEDSVNKRAGRQRFVFEMTDQNGNPVHMPAQDQDALMQGMMLHEKGRNLLYGKKLLGKPTHVKAKEALPFFQEAEGQFRQVDPAFVALVDNYAYVCLDIVWCLFILQDLSNLDLAERLLSTAKEGFAKAHGSNLERLRAVKGPHCAERVLYVRLHFLTGALLLA
eukprot:CAMPEP_0206404802 /NCGR_PEP_ID=MMETSP0294-20121207/28655_1 /ASSEMBLY_ACC=CAM_ASM_000327 /TAXON_ID=39354 /ORGANISM="Heterosigma akashiwo, Strain CCMP2393" /LENGTH=272 /DNA_ID=CAMNT_0053862909 /DNA_START=35 /DNA_END=850 /DNA_ORIENTATION=+